MIYSAPEQVARAQAERPPRPALLGVRKRPHTRSGGARACLSGCVRGRLCGRQVCGRDERRRSGAPEVKNNLSRVCELLHACVKSRPDLQFKWGPLAREPASLILSLIEIDDRAPAPRPQRSRAGRAARPQATWACRARRRRLNGVKNSAPAAELLGAVKRTGQSINSEAARIKRARAPTGAHLAQTGARRLARRSADGGRGREPVLWPRHGARLPRPCLLLPELAQLQPPPPPARSFGTGRYLSCSFIFIYSRSLSGPSWRESRPPGSSSSLNKSGRAPDKGASAKINPNKQRRALAGSVFGPPPR